MDERCELQGVAWKEDEEGATRCENENSSEYVNELKNIRVKLEQDVECESGNIVVSGYDTSASEVRTNSELQGSWTVVGHEADRKSRSSELHSVAKKEEDNGLTLVHNNGNAHSNGNIIDVGIKKLEHDVSYECGDIVKVEHDWSREEVGSDSSELRSADWKQESEVYTLENDTADSGKNVNNVNTKIMKLEPDVPYEHSTSDDKPYQRNDCNYVCTRPDQLRRHVMTHTGERTFVCNVCNFIFSRSDHLQGHMRTHTGEKPFACSVCNATFSRSDHLKRHVETHTEEDENMIYPKKVNLEQDVFYESEKPFACDVCNFTCSRSDHLKGHMVVHPGENGRIIAMKKVNLEQDVEFECEDETAQCEQPRGEGEPGSYELRSADRKQEDEVCASMKDATDVGGSVVNVSTKRVKLARVNRQRSTCKSGRSISGNNRYKCIDCSYTCSRVDSFRRHVMTHTGGKPFACNVCNFSCSRSDSFKVHMMTHTGEKPFACNVCNFKCRRSDQLKRHVTAHAGKFGNMIDMKKANLDQDVSYECGGIVSVEHDWSMEEGEPGSYELRSADRKQEGEVYTLGNDTADSGKNVIRVNTKRVKLDRDAMYGSGPSASGSKPYKCSDCNYACLRPYQLRRHVMVHTGEKPFACDVCNFTCSRSENLTRHMLVHPGENGRIIAMKKVTLEQHVEFECEDETVQREQPRGEGEPGSYELRSADRKQEDEVCTLMKDATDVGESVVNVSTKRVKLERINRRRSTYKSGRSISGNNHYKCIDCNYTCSRVDSFRRHVMTHTGEKPFACNVCNFSCSRSDSFKVHMMTHTGEKPFACNVCNFKCRRTDQLKRHVTAHAGKCGNMIDMKKANLDQDVSYECGDIVSVEQDWSREEVGSDRSELRSADWKQEGEVYTLGNDATDSGKNVIRVNTKRVKLDRDAMYGSGPSASGSKPYKCNDCNYACRRPYQLRRHVMTHTGEKPFACGVCNFTCSRSGNLTRHMLVHPGENGRIIAMKKVNLEEDVKFVCEDETVQRERPREEGEPGSYELRSADRKQEDEVCTLMKDATYVGGSVVNVSTKRAKLARINQQRSTYKSGRTISGNNRYKCIDCNYTCSRVDRFRLHVMTHTGEKPFACNVCNFSCSRSDNFKVHMMTHTGEKPFACNVCNFKCRRSDQLKRHVTAHAGECGNMIDMKKVNFDRSELRLADRKQEDDAFMLGSDTSDSGENVINVNKKRAKLEQDATNESVHSTSGDKPYKCNVCNYTCSRTDYLKCHSLIHTEEKRFACSVCNFKFRRSTHLRVHMRTHTGEKPFACDVCNFTCSRSDHLKRHEATHTDEKPYACCFCDFSCTRPSQLKTHVMRFHSGV